MIDQILILHSLKRYVVQGLLLLMLLSSCAEEKAKAVEETPPVQETTIQEAAAPVLTQEKDTSTAALAMEEEESKVAPVEKEEEKTEKEEEKAKEKKKKKRKKRPRVKFENKVHEYGLIMQGDTIEHKFVFKNTGEANLVIKNVTASCGCTQPSYPFVPIEPGEEGFIGVVFDSKGKLGKQKPTITVVTNARPHTYKLYLDGFVDAQRADEVKQDNE